MNLGGLSLFLVLASNMSPAAPMSLPAEATTDEATTDDTANRSLTSSAALAEVFADPDFAFCHEESFPLSNKEFRWCTQVPDNLEACPKLKALCARGATAVEREPYNPDVSFNFPDLPNLPSFAFWLVVGGLVGVLVWLIVRNLIQWQPKAEAGEATPASTVVALHGADQVIETDVQRLLAKARMASAEGQMTAAVAFAHAALLRRLEGQGLIKVHNSRTTSDYLRDLSRAAPEHRPAVAKLLGDVDKAQFAGHPTDGSFVAALIERVVSLNVAIRPLLGLLVLGILLFGAGCNLSSRDDWEHSPSGIEAVVRYLQKTGLDARERLAPLSKLNAETSHLILLPNVSVSDEEWELIGEWVAQGGQLILAPGPKNLPDWLRIEFDKVESADQVVRRMLNDAPLSKATQLQAGAYLPEALQGLAVAAPIERTFAAPSLKVYPLLVHDKRVYAAALSWEAAGGEDKNEKKDGDKAPGPSAAPQREAQAEPPEAQAKPSEAADEAQVEDELGGGAVFAFADRNLFSNAALLVADNARFVRALLDDGAKGRVELAGDLAGLVSPNPIASVGRGKLAPFMAQVALFLLVLFAARGAMFGAPRQVFASGRRRFAEHVQAIGLQFRRAHAHRHVLFLLGTYLVERLRHRARQTGQTAVGALAESLAKQEGRPVGEMARHLFAAKEDSPLQGEGRRARQEELRDHIEAIEALAALLATKGPSAQTLTANKTRTTAAAGRGDVRITTTGSSQ